MKKVLLTLILILPLLLLCSLKVEATLELEQLDFNVQINDDGSMDVIETWDIYISETNTLFKTFKRDTSKYSGISEVEVYETTDGANKKFLQINEEMYHVTKDCFYALNNSNGMFEIAWGVGLDNDSDNRKYQISYKVKDAIAKYNDYSELYWQFIGEEFEIDANKINGTIKLPQNVTNEQDIKVWGHTEDLNGEIYVTGLNKIEFTINQYSGGKYVEVRSLMPNYLINSTRRQYNYDILDEVLKEEVKWAEEANQRREKREKIAQGVAILVVMLTVFFAYKVFSNIVKLCKLEKKFKPTTKLEYFRELPYEDATPAEAVFILSNGANKAFSSSFSANILELCLEKYISLEVIKKESKLKSDVVKIKLLEKDDSILKKDIKLTLDFLKEVAGKNNELTTKQITKYLEKHLSKVSTLDKKLDTILEKEQKQRGNYIKENYDKMNKYGGFFAAYLVSLFLSIGFMAFFDEMNHVEYIFYVLALMLTLIINMVLQAIMASKVNIFSQQGVDEKEKWKAFKKYMVEFSLLKEKEIPSLVLWEKYLVFATAFGISEKVLKQLKVVYPEITDMNSTLYNYSYIHMMDSVNIGSCINNSVYSAVGSSGSGSGGGFSGGGGGGRWPEAAVADAKRRKGKKGKRDRVFFYPGKKRPGPFFPFFPFSMSSGKSQTNSKCS